MSQEMVFDIIFDALRDSAIVFAFVLLIHVLLSFFENSLSKVLIKKKKASVVFGSLFGLVPQCGTSIMGADLYIKKYITIGTLTAIFLSCSDEALIAILASGKPDKMLMVLPMIGLKFLIGIVVGLLTDLIFRKQDLKGEGAVLEEETCHTHHVHNSEAHRHLVHPLIHSLEIFAYVLVINLVLGFVIGFVGEEKFASFILMNKYLAPLFASIIGLIPNCASSLLLAELFIEGNISFGAILAGLLVNAGLGFTVLLRNRKGAKNIVWILLICFITAVVAGYITCLIIGF